MIRSRLDLGDRTEILVGPRRLSYPSEGTKIRALASHRLVELLLTRDASDMCEEQGLTRIDLLMALRTCAVTGSERRGMQWRRTVRGNDFDGNSIVMIVTVVYQVRRILVLEVELES
jgi:hypothetical protein